MLRSEILVDPETQTRDEVIDFMTKTAYGRLSPESTPERLRGAVTMQLLCRQWSADIASMSARLRVDARVVEQQLRLHAPSVDERRLRQEDGLIPRELAEALHRRLEPYPAMIEQYLRCVGDILSGPAAGLRLSRHPGPSAVLFSEVSPELSALIEGRLHYLRSYRADALLRFGAFGPESTAPILYTSITACDRRYIREALRGALHNAVADSPILVIGRAYGVPGLPKNMMSQLYGLVCKELARHGARFVITAVNPYLGFDGRSLLASGFIPFGLAPVAYQYDENGCYVTRRHRERARAAQWSPAPNVLLVRALDRTGQRAADRIDRVVVISKESHRHK